MKRKHFFSAIIKIWRKENEFQETFGVCAVNYWVNRISHRYTSSAILLRYGYLSIGWSDSSVEIKNAADKSWELYKEQYDRVFSKNLHNADSLWRFLKEYQIGDIVIVPHIGKHSDKISIVSIQGDAELSEIPDLVDIGFVRRVEQLANNFPRSRLVEATGKSIFACRKTTYNISKYKDAIQSIVMKS